MIREFDNLIPTVIMWWNGGHVVAKCIRQNETRGLSTYNLHHCHATITYNVNYVINTNPCRIVPVCPSVCLNVRLSCKGRSSPLSAKKQLSFNSDAFPLLFLFLIFFRLFRSPPFRCPFPSFFSVA